MKIKKGDNVYILSGKDKGKTGVVERAFPAEGKIVVKGIALYKKHVKPSKKSPQGGIIDINRKISASTAIMLCPNCGKPARIGYSVTEKGKTRVCKKCNQSVESGKS